VWKNLKINIFVCDNQYPYENGLILLNPTDCLPKDGNDERDGNIGVL
jgi:hypothetical protein